MHRGFKSKFLLSDVLDQGCMVLGKASLRGCYRRVEEEWMLDLMGVGLCVGSGGANARGSFKKILLEFTL